MPRDSMHRVRVLALTFGACLMAHAGIIPTNLLCESQSGPIGITETAPRLSWQLVDTIAGERGQCQTSYRIQVASSPQILASNQGDLWDTGQVTSNRTTQIVYGGLPLSSGKNCYWHVQVWDKEGTPSGWSSQGLWSMGLLTNADWSAQWIGRDDAPQWNQSSISQANWIYYPQGNPASSAPVGHCYFRKTLSSAGGTTLSQAIISMTADDAFTLYVNGQTALTGNSWSQVSTADITKFFNKTGNNMVAVDVVNAGSSPSPAGLIGAFTIVYANNSTNTFLTDGTWMTTNSLVANWNQPAYNPAGWASAMVLGAYGMSPWGNVCKSYSASTYLRKDFTLSQAPSNAVLYITALGLVEPHLNGAQVGNELFTPGWTDYRQRVYYRTYDVTSLLHQGINTLAAILGDGWFRGSVFLGSRNFYGTKTRLLAELHVTYPDGTTQAVVTDPTWQAGFGPILQSDIQDGETYDARLEVPGWDNVGYSNAAWRKPTAGAEVSPLLQAYPEKPMQTHQEFAPIAITQPTNGVYIFKFGQSFAGWTRLKVSAPAGTKIEMKCGEWLNSDGTMYHENYRSALTTDTYICKGGGTEVWEPHFSYRAFQYMQVTGLPQPPAADTLTGVSVYSSFDEVGPFVCSNDQINHFWSNMVWSLRTAYCDIPTASQDRNERTGWTGDAIHIMRSGMFTMETENFFSSWYQSCVDDKVSAQVFPQMAPDPSGFGDFSAAWQDCAVEVPYMLYKMYGNLRVAQRFYSHMTNHIAYYTAHSTGYIGPNSGYGDWVPIDGSTPLNLVSTACYAHCCDEVAELAQALGNSADALKYRQLFTNISAAFQSAFVSADGTVGSGSQTCYAIALAYNLLTPAQRALASTKIAGAINASGGNPTTGFIGVHLILPTLSNISRSDLAYKMLAKTNYPSWGFQLNLGATTFWELWNAVNADGTFNTSQQGMASLNMPNFGTIEEWFYSGILGIDGLQPGFKQIMINPQTGGGLTSAQGSYNSVQGKIASSWTVTNSLFNLNVAIPPNTTAIVYVLTTNASGILESGVPAANAPGITFAGVTNSRAVFAVGSGSYSFSSQVDPAMALDATPLYPQLTTDAIPATAVDIVGSQATFVANFSGASPIYYQWQKISGGVTNNLAGATTPTLTLKNLQLGDTASYQLLASNVYGAAISSPRPLTVNSVPTPVNNIVTAYAAQTGLGVGSDFYTTWTPAPGNLIAGMAPSSVGSGDFSEPVFDQCGTVAVMTDGNIGFFRKLPGNGDSPTEVACGSGAGQSVTYTLTATTNGYNLTNITVYGGWGDAGRDQQAFTIYYSKATAPTTFIQMSQVNYQPSDPLGVQSAIRSTLTAASGYLATNVAALKFDFTTPAPENGYTGYSEIQVFGVPTRPLTVPPTVGVAALLPSSFALSIGGMVVGRNYQVQSTTNLVQSVWVTETNFLASATSISITNSIPGTSCKFYRVMGL